MKQRPEIQENVELEALNTLHVPARARFYVKVHTADELVQSLNWVASEDLEVLILGGGSNLVFAGDFSGLVVRLAIRGRRWSTLKITRLPWFSAQVRTGMRRSYMPPVPVIAALKILR